MASNIKFASKIGMIAATVGSAVGLGNVWRFPADVQANGGAIFLLIYICCIFLLGIPVMIAEFALGRGGESDAVGVYSKITPQHKSWRYVGVLAILSSYIILSFYMVVSGWTFEYLIQSVTGDLYSSAVEGEMAFRDRMGSYITGTFRPIVVTVLMIFGNMFVLIRGVQRGIEKMSNIMMPILFILLLIFCGVSLSLDKAREGLEFFLRPDFSVVTPATVINALGQSFFSLSLAMGILVTYSSYFPADARLTRTAVTVSLLDLMVAVFMGIIIFPAVMTFGLENSNLAGSALVFVTLPEIFAQMGGTRIWSTLFFMLLTVAAFTSTISLAEVSVSFMQNRIGLSRKRAVMSVTLPLLILSPICSLSVGPWSGFTIAGLTIFDFLDTITTNFMLPLGGILLCIYVGWIAPKNFFRNELSNNGSLRIRSTGVIYFIIRWIAPVLIAVILLWQLLRS
ncbi:MAG: sodium-dependent transporter [Duncaniella sp.]|nr:sodium-dependent transporter [Duncaniella sp.]